MVVPKATTTQLNTYLNPPQSHHTTTLYCVHTLPHLRPPTTSHHTLLPPLQTSTPSSQHTCPQVPERQPTQEPTDPARLRQHRPRQHQPHHRLHQPLTCKAHNSQPPRQFRRYTLHSTQQTAHRSTKISIGECTDPDRYTNCCTNTRLQQCTTPTTTPLDRTAPTPHNQKSRAGDKLHRTRR